MKKAQREAIDELYRVRELMKPLQKREKELKNQLLPLGHGFHKGFEHWAIIEEGHTSHFDADAIKAAWPEEKWMPFWVTTNYLKISVKPAPAKDKKPAPTETPAPAEVQEKEAA